jgi:glycosyltransferase involved in cell wall biosynthesis
MMGEREKSGPWKLGIYPRYSEQGASSRLRYYLYRDALVQAGFAPEFHPLLGDEYLRRLYSGHGKSKKLFLKALVSRFFRTAALEENLLVEYELFPFLPAAAELLLIGKRKFVLNFDDLVWEKYRTIPFLKNKYDRLIRRAAGVITANHLLFERAEKLNANAILVPTVVDLQKYVSPPLLLKKDGFLRAAWIGTPVTYRACFLPFAETFKKLCATFPLEFLVIARADLPVIDGVPMQCVDWDEKDEAGFLASCDLGVMPLVDDDFSRGKSAYKLIQYAAAGLPAVASPVGENARFITHGDNGFLASSPEEWAAALQSLLVPARRKEMADRMRERSFDCSLQKYAPVMTDFLKRSFGR